MLTLAAGLLLLAAWFYATRGNPRAPAMFKRSLLLFGLPLLLWPGPMLLRLPFGIWLASACEEGLKAFASTQEERSQDKFSFVVLFGIWELILDKPVRALLLPQGAQIWSSLPMAGLVYATALPVLMHALTAAIYASARRQRLWVAFVVSWILHSLFNEAGNYFVSSPPLVILESAMLGIFLAVLITHLRERNAQHHD
jgi:hypothetical protein